MKEKIKKIAGYVDYCSAVPDWNMNSCCKQHDDDYENLGKWEADWKFLRCGLDKAKSYIRPHRIILTSTVAVTYYIGVTLFGWIPYWRAQKRGS